LLRWPENMPLCNQTRETVRRAAHAIFASNGFTNFARWGNLAVQAYAERG
jgi:hypothetical protein